jgi:hypothetical protein
MRVHERPRLRALLACIAAECAWVQLAPGHHMTASAQTLGEPEDFTAVAIVNDNIATGAGTVDIRVTRWSSDAESRSLVNALLQKGPDDLLRELQKTRPVGTIKTPDTLAYDLHYAHQTPGEDGGRRIVIATDRPIGFWEAANQPRTITYPFTVIQMQIGRDGMGSGTLSYATKITGHDNVIELENYSTSPVMLTKIEARPIGTSGGRSAR